MFLLSINTESFLRVIMYTVLPMIFTFLLGFGIAANMFMKILDRVFDEFGKRLEKYDKEKRNKGK